LATGEAVPAFGLPQMTEAGRAPVFCPLGAAPSCPLTWPGQNRQRVVILSGCFVLVFGDNKLMISANAFPELGTQLVLGRLWGAKWTNQRRECPLLVDDLTAVIVRG
jgi:hypothetical protein